jgi:hypothetical protein
MRYHAFDLPRVIREREEARARREEENRRIADTAERARRTRLQVVEEDFTLHCPRCRGAFVDFNGCAALYCKDDAGPPPRKGCGISFCALCLQDCEGDAHAEADGEGGVGQQGDQVLRRERVEGQDGVAQGVPRGGIGEQRDGPGERLRGRRSGLELLQRVRDGICLLGGSREGEEESGGEDAEHGGSAWDRVAGGGPV